MLPDVTKPRDRSGVQKKPESLIPFHGLSEKRIHDSNVVLTARTDEVFFAHEPNMFPRVQSAGGCHGRDGDMHGIPAVVPIRNDFPNGWSSV